MMMTMNLILVDDDHLGFEVCWTVSLFRFSFVDDSSSSSSSSDESGCLFFCFWSGSSEFDCMLMIGKLVDGFGCCLGCCCSSSESSESSDECDAAAGAGLPLR